MKNINLNFESVSCGQKKVKTLYFENTSEETKTYVISSGNYKHLNAGSKRLRIHPLKAVVLPGKKAIFTLTYLSYLEDVIDNVEYNILESNEVVARINVHAQTIGPKFTASTYTLKFYCFRKLSETEKKFEFKNISACPAKFWFELNESNPVLQITPTNGVIPANTKIGFKLTFKPEKPGVYHKRIYCLIQFHKPLILNVTGLYYPKIQIDPKKLILKYPFDVKCPSTKEMYMEKMNASKISLEKVTFLNRCAREYRICSHDSNLKMDSTDFRQYYNYEPFDYQASLTKYFCDVKNFAEHPKATTLVNLSESDELFYLWDQDPKNIFHLEPRMGTVKPNETINFTIYFTPSVPDQVFSTETDLRIFSRGHVNEINCQNTVYLPFTMSLKIIGNSFSEDNCGWLHQCTVIPKFVQFPSCLPTEVTYANIMIERQGHLPVTFTTHLPQESKYIVQPPLGCITGKYQLFLIKFKGATDKGVYTEELKIVYNNSKINTDVVTLETFVETPEIIFAENNSYTFHCTFPGSITTVMIPYRNLTNLSIRYDLIVPEDVKWINIPNATGTIEPMAMDFLEVTFKPEVPCEYLDYVQCNMITISDLHNVEHSYLQLIGSSQFGYLVATPNIHDFGEIIYGEKRTLKINLFNFSPVLLHFRLHVEHRAFPVGNIEEDVTVTPFKGSIPGKLSTEIEITVEPHGKDIFQYVLLYEILENDSPDAPTSEKAQKIFLFRFEGVLPTFQVLDLNIEGGGPLFSPHWLWKMMSINRLNQALDSLAAEEEIDVRLPEAMIEAPLITITLLIEAKKFGNVSWNLEKNTICECSVSRIKPIKTCVHSKALFIKPNEAQMKPEERLQIRIKINYKTLEECNLQWTLNLPFQRRIILNTKVISLPKEKIPVTSMYLEPNLNLRPIFIGDRDPPLQLFWLYNNTDHPSSYALDDEDLKRSLQGIFDFINPRGSIPPFSCVPVAVLFRPNEILSYSTEINLRTKENLTVPFRLKGEGVACHQQIPELCFEKTIPEKSFIKNQDIGFECSVNFINIPYIRAFSEANRLFFLSNTSENHALAFHWHSFRIENFISAHVKPSQGVLEAGQKITMTLILKSFSFPTFLNFSIPCDIINYTLLQAYESALQFHEIMEEKTKDYFTITEKGISYEAPKIYLPEKPVLSHLFLTIHTNIISCVNPDQKLLLNQQSSLKFSRTKLFGKSLSPSVQTLQLPFRNIMENVLWNILNNEFFKNKINVLQKSPGFNYLQMMPLMRKNYFRQVEGKLTQIGKNYIQDLLQETLKKIVSKNFNTE